MLSLRAGSENGQALVEMAIVLPLLLFVIFAMIQFGAIVHTKILMAMAARQGIRLVASRTAGEAVSQVENFLNSNSALPGLHYEVVCRRTLSMDRVVISCDFPVMPMFQHLLGEKVALREEMKSDAYGVPLLGTLVDLFSRWG